MTFEPQFRVPRRWGRRFVVAVVAIALLAGLALWISSLFSGSESAERVPDRPAATESTGDAGRVANGCLGGQALTAQTVLTAQRDAQLDDIGAAEFAATLMRWTGGEGGVPPVDEVPIVFDAIQADQASEEVMSQEQRLMDAAEAERQGVETSTVEGGYYVEGSTEHEVVVSVLTVDRAPAPDEEQVMAFSASLTLDRSTGSWTLVDYGGARELADLAEIMSPFVGGC